MIEKYDIISGQKVIRMDSLYLNEKFLVGKQLKPLKFICGKMFYHNPFDDGELIAVFPKNIFEYTDIEERLTAFGNIEWNNEGAIVPLRKVYLDDVLRGYTLKFVKDSYDLSFLRDECDCDSKTKLLFLRRIDSIVKYLHNNGVVSKDLNPTNLLFDAYAKPYVIDLFDSKIGDIASVVCSSDLCSLYNRDFKYLPDIPEIDNVNMHINMLYLMLPDIEFKRCLYGSIDEYNRVIKGMHLNHESTDTLIRVKKYEKIKSIPPVTQTINQII